MQLDNLIMDPIMPIWRLPATVQAAIVHGEAERRKKAQSNLNAMEVLCQRPFSPFFRHSKDGPRHIATRCPDHPPWPHRLCNPPQQQRQHSSQERRQVGSKGESNSSDGMEAGAGAGVEDGIIEPDLYGELDWQPVALAQPAPSSQVTPSGLCQGYRLADVLCPVYQ